MYKTRYDEAREYAETVIGIRRDFRFVGQLQRSLEMEVEIKFAGFVVGVDYIDDRTRDKAKRYDLDQLWADFQELFDA